MPIYQFRCEVCGHEAELLLAMGKENPSCCGVKMTKLPTFPAMVKIKGSGGYPSRRKLVKGTAPYSSA